MAQRLQCIPEDTQGGYVLSDPAKNHTAAAGQPRSQESFKAKEPCETGWPADGNRCQPDSGQ
eukprot:11167017-Lingulodinium_polyedra.AAC.1